MPLVIVKMLEGRTQEQKKNLIQSVTDAVVKSVNVGAEHVQVILEDVPKTHWGMAGKTALEILGP